MAASVAVAALVCGCSAAPTAIARGQETAAEFNQDARFGRYELLLERVAPAARDGFAARHRAWGSGVRIVDVEIAGMKPQGDRELSVMARFAWYRPEQQELRQTTVEQRWRDENGWHLVGEQRIDGDVGLLGESVVYSVPGQGRPPARFPTVRIGGDGE